MHVLTSLLLPVAGRRERPQVLMVDGQPAVLFTGASMGRLGGMAHTFTLAQAIATDP